MGGPIPRCKCCNGRFVKTGTSLCRKCEAKNKTIGVTDILSRHSSDGDSSFYFNSNEGTVCPINLTEDIISFDGIPCHISVDEQEDDISVVTNPISSWPPTNLSAVNSSVCEMENRLATTGLCQTEKLATINELIC
eukprot:scaffold9435_cov137-Cylindrotheca_fusiformis.AAC.7